MSNCNSEIQIDDNIRPYLDVIAERLWSKPSHAAIMVGAGFSKNANKDFPSWAALGDLFFEKIHRRKPDKNKEGDRYLNVLKLAYEVETAFGRQELDQLLRSNIPDNDSEPSALHITLLELPWTDVFTTNYDTLLERARDAVSSQKFDIVVNKEDLMYSQKPRIIKLHGSFPSKRPFIITEEDYRTYPKEFAPFVNTVQQSLLENTLCLIGFSGDDPNFLQWIGWIRDNLGKEKSLKIYLLGIFNLLEPQKKAFERRNIILVDLGKCPGVDNDHYKALERFFDYINSRQKINSRLDWPGSLKKSFPDINADKNLQLKEIVEEWRQTRLSYPGWVVVPEDRRGKLWSFTIEWADYISANDQLTEQLDLRFSFELNWRLERCLWPLPNDVIELFEAVISKYWPFKETFREQSEVSFIDKKYQSLNWKEIRNMWLHLFLAMLRFYREEGFCEKWEEINKKLNNLIKYLSKTEKAFLYYERVLFALFKLDIHKVRAELSSWPMDFSIPFWEAKRAGLLAEIEQTEKAEQILERSLQEIRLKLNLNPVTTDYSLVSEEATVMVLLKYIKNSKGLFGNFTEATVEEISKIRNKFIENIGESRDSDREKDRKDTVITDMSEGNLEIEWNKFFEKRNNAEKPEWNKLLIDIRSTEIEVLSKSLQKRWDDLKLYKCDPWNEIKLFESQLQRPLVEQIPVTEKYEFDIGRITGTHHMPNFDKEASSAFKFLRYFEDSGFPFRIPGTNLGKKSAEGALTRLFKYSPYWAMATLIRIGDAKITDLIFNRQALLKYSANEVDTLIDKYLEVLDRVAYDMNDETGLNVDTLGVFFVQIVPEILSRLCCKCSENKKLLLFDFLRKVYASEYKNNYRGIGHLLKRLLETFSVYEQYQLLPKLVEIHYPKNTNVITEHEYVNPFLLINIKKTDIDSATKVGFELEIIESLFNLASSETESERKWGTSSLVQLYKLNLLTHDQTKKLGDILWSKVDNIGFPVSTDYFKFVFLNLPHPEDINPADLIKTYIKNTDFPIHDIQKKKSFSLTPDYIPLCDEIIGTSRFVDWSKEEIDDLLGRLVQWWNADKKYLKQDKVNFFLGTIAENVEKSFARLIDVLVEVVLPVLNDDLTSESQRNAINQLVREFSEYGFYTVRVKSASLPLLQLEEDVLRTEIETALSSEDNKEVIDGLKALLILLKTNFPIKNNIIKKTLVLLGQKIRWQHQAGLVSALNTVTLILREYQKYFNGELETLCLHGVKTLATETSFSLNKNMAKADFFRRLGLRQAAAYLAFTLYKFYDNKETDIPEEVLLWRTICSSQDEFAEIRVQWQESNE